LQLKPLLGLAFMVAIPFRVAADPAAAVDERVFSSVSTTGAWPTPLALASTWDRGLVRDLHHAIGGFARATGVRLVVGPSLDLARDPRLGRVERTLGSDAYLSAELAVAALEGLHAAGIAAAIAGFAGPASPAPGTDVDPVPISERELREAYLPPFEAAVRRGRAEAIVLSRNSIDGMPTHANRWLLRDVLRAEWGFQGAVLADAGGIQDLKSPYRMAATAADAMALAGEAGVDKVGAKAFDSILPASAPPRPLAELALLAAQRSIVLLKNEGVLPLRRSATGSEASVVFVDSRDLASGERQVQALKRDGKRVVAVLTGDRPALSVALAENADAIVAAWGLGELSARAVAAVLSGDVNPGGKLPITIARNAGQLPIYHDVKPSARRGYLFDTTEPLFAFGWGLGYSTFELGPPRLSVTAIEAKGSVQIALDVRNTGPREGDETLQLYVREKVSSVARPVKRLLGFERVRLAAGETRTVRFTLEARSLEGWDEAMHRVLEPGEFGLMTGADSAHLQSATLTVKANLP
jgi:beta-glucosidase-like glycosyl hydrolase